MVLTGFVEGQLHEKAAAGQLYFIAAFANDPDTAVMRFQGIVFV